MGGRAEWAALSAITSGPTMPTPATLLRSWLTGRLDPAAFEWLDDRLAAVRGGDRRALLLAFGLTPRKVGKADLDLSSVELQAAEDARPGWNPSAWSTDHAARTLLLLAFPSEERAVSHDVIDRLFAAGEVGELVALYQALPLLPEQESHIARAAVGLRTNITPVFAAIAHRNPFPAERFDEAAWNQMVLKCLFVGLSLAPVVDLDARANPALTAMLLDYAAERRAAGREVSAELWRCVAATGGDVTNATHPS